METVENSTKQSEKFGGKTGQSAEYPVLSSSSQTLPAVKETKPLLARPSCSTQKRRTCHFPPIQAKSSKPKARSPPTATNQQQQKTNPHFRITNHSLFDNSFFAGSILSARKKQQTNKQQEPCLPLGKKPEIQTWHSLDLHRKTGQTSLL